MAVTLDVSDLELLAPGVPVVLQVSELQLIAPPQAATLQVSELELVAPAQVAQTMDVTIRPRARFVVDMRPVFQANMRPIVTVARIRIQTSADQRFMSAVIRARPQFKVAFGQAIHASTQLTIHARPRFEVAFALQLPVPIETVGAALVPLVLSWPLRVGRDGALTTVAQDSDAELLQTSAILIATEPGSRKARPEFGLADGTFTREPVNPDEVNALVTAWDDRIDSVQTVTDLQGRLALVSVSVHEREDA